LEDIMQFVSSQQVNLMHTMASDAVEAVNRLAALNLRTAQESVQLATETCRQMIAAREPSDFFALAHQSQQGFERFLAYGRELFTLTTGLESRIRETVSAAAADAEAEAQAQAAAIAAPAYPGQDEHPKPDGDDRPHNFQPPPQRDVMVRKAARNQ
jgi:phasin family protein